MIEKLDAPPKAVNTMAVKEEGDNKFTIPTDVQKQLAGDKNHLLVFLDDASYSGSQFSKMLAQFDKVPRSQIKIGQVASSDDAHDKVGALKITGDNYLAEPLKIKKPERPEDIANLTTIAKTIKPLKFDRKKAESPESPGLYQTALYYKIPDYASTMDYIPFHSG